MVPGLLCFESDHKLLRQTRSNAARRPLVLHMEELRVWWYELQTGGVLGHIAKAHSLLVCPAGEEPGEIDGSWLD